VSLQARLDAFKADFRAGKPPFSIPLSVIETMDGATNEPIPCGRGTSSVAARRLRWGGRPRTASMCQSAGRWNQQEGSRPR
jgi:hypothetical protein